MKVSRTWLQKHFTKELPSSEELATLLTFHAFEIEEYDEDMLDVKVLPDRAAYALSHRGIAGELSAILDIPLSYDQFTEPVPEWPTTDRLSVVAAPEYVIRHTGALIEGVKVGPSPEWLKASLESVGQRSINNVVDALNCVMLAIGQPSGAFDAGKLQKDADGAIRIEVREAKAGEKITALTGEEYALAPGMYVFTDAVGGELLDIAGIKGGKSSGVTEATTDIFLSVGTYEPALIRRASQSLKLFTDASLRYQNRPSPELTAYGMRHLVDLITSVAGGTLAGVIDFYPNPEGTPAPVMLKEGDVNARLGSSFSEEEVKGAFTRLGFSIDEGDGAYRVTPPFVRRDVVIPEDLAEEAGRILGYDRVIGTELPPAETPDLARYRGIERVKDLLVERGFTEISTPSFAAKGDIKLANPLQSEKPYLRADLAGNMKDAVARAVLVAPRVLGVAPDVRLFEIGTVFEADGERLSLVLGYAPVAGKKKPVLEDVAGELSTLLNISASAGDSVLEIALGETDLEKLGAEFAPRRIALQKYKSFSVYPFATRDIAVWTPEGTEESEVLAVLLKEAGDLLARVDQFDRFEKDGKISYAFRLVFESFEKTLADTDLDPVMERITAALNGREGWQVR